MEAVNQKRIEVLPFTIRLVKSEEALQQAVKIRQAAYARHVPEFAQTLMSPDETDLAEGVDILLAQSKAHGAPIGTVRIQTNEFRPLSVEQSIELPLAYQGKRLAEITRLGVESGSVGRVVRFALFKAINAYCIANHIDYLIGTGRAPVDRQYEQLMMDDVFSEKEYIPLKHVGNIPHRVMSMDMKNIFSRWSQAQHRFFDFFVNVDHPDIDITGQHLEQHEAEAQLQAA